MDIARLYEIGRNWETATNEECAELKAIVREIVGYSCRLCCRETGWLINPRKWIEIDVQDEQMERSDSLSLSLSTGFWTSMGYYDFDEERETELIAKIERINNQVPR